MTREEALKIADAQLVEALQSGSVHEEAIAKGLPSDPSALVKAAMRAREVIADRILAEHDQRHRDDPV